VNDIDVQLIANVRQLYSLFISMIVIKNMQYYRDYRINKKCYLSCQIVKVR